MKSQPLRRSPLAMLIVLALASGHAAAQQAESPANAGVSSNEAKTLDTVVVTATKREKQLRDIPAAITVVGGSDLEQRGAQNLEDILKLTPGVNMTSPANNAQRITIRGIAGAANTNATTGILFGNTSFTDAYVPRVTLDPNPFDIETVEVLKGPQGTLFGASALNGALRYTPVQPEFGEIGGKYYVEGGQVSEGSGLYGAGVALNLSNSDKVAFRLVAFDRKVPGWIDNLLTAKKDANQGNQTGARGILAIKPNDALDVRLTYVAQKTSNDDSALAGNYNGILENGVRPRPSPGENRYEFGNLSVGYDFGGFRFDSETSAIHKQWEATTEDSGSLLPPAVIDALFGGRNPPIAQNVANLESDTISQEFRLTSNDAADSPWSWIVGVFGSQQDVNQVSTEVLGDPSLNPAIPAMLLNSLAGGLGDLWLALGQPYYSDSIADVRVKETAFFFDVTRKFAQDFELGLGGRLYRTESGGTVRNSGLLLTAIGHPNSLVDDKVKDSGFSPKVSLLWRARDNVNLYTSASKGYRVGGLQWGTAGLSGTAPNTFKTDHIWNYEVGIRAHSRDNSLSFDATAFYEKWKDPQVLSFVFVPLPSAYVDNVSSVTSKGVEAALRYRFPVDGLSLDLSAAYTDAKLDKAYLGGDGRIVPAGREWAMAAKFQAAATLAYDRSHGDWLFGGSLSGNYKSPTTYDIEQPGKVFGYSLLDAQLRVSNTRWKSEPELSLTVSNLADRRGLATAYAGPGVDPAGQFWFAGGYVQPRTITLRLSGRF